MTITVKLSKETMKEMNEFYDDYKRLKTPPYAVFQADDADCVVTLYESGKAVFQGKTADLSSQMWIEMEKHNNPNKRVEVTNSDNKKKEKIDRIDKNIYNSSSIGSDEVGTGDYFGPIVVTAAFVRKDQVGKIANMGVKDSKKLTDEEILTIVPKFIKDIKYHTYVMSAEEYNKVYNPQSMNLNKIKAILHNKALMELVNQNLNQDYIVVDQFCEPRNYYNYLKETNNVVKGITFITKGEDNSIAVACASLISRYTFLQEFDKLSKKIGYNLPKNANTITDQVGVEIVKKEGFDILKKIAKLNFKNTDKIKDLINN